MYGTFEAGKLSGFSHPAMVRRISLSRDIGMTVTHSESNRMQPNRNAMNTDALGAGQSLLPISTWPRSREKCGGLEQLRVDHALPGNGKALFILRRRVANAISQWSFPLVVRSCRRPTNLLGVPD